MSDKGTLVGPSFWGDTDDTDALHRYRTLVDAVDDGIYQLDAKGHFVGVNEMIVEATGYSRENLLGEHVSLVLDDSDIERIRQDFLRRLKDGNRVDDTASYETTVKTADGDILTCELQISLLLSDGEFCGSIGIVRDITERKQRERHLEVELDEVVERIADGFFAIDTDWNITHINERAKEILEAKDRNLVGKNIWEEFPKAAGTQFEEEYRRAMETQEPTTIQEYYQPLDAWFEDHVYPSETGLSVYFKDITEHKEYEQELELFRALLDHSTDSIFVIEPSTGELLDVNGRACRRLRYDREELIGRSVLDIEKDLPDLAAWRSHIEETKTSGAVTFDGEHERKDGTTFPVEVNVSYVELDKGYILAVARDVTARREHETELKQHKEYTDEILDAIDDVFYVLDGNGSLERWNETVSEVTGYSGDEIETMYALDFFSGTDREQIADAIAEGFETGTTQVEANLQTKDGNAIPYEFVANRLKNPTGDQVLVGIGRDVTDREQKRRQLEETIKQLEISNERLEQFAYAASHDLQEPLRMVTSYLQLIEKRYDDALDEDGEEFIEFAIDGAERMREMIDGLLQYSRVETRGNPFEPVYLNEVLEDVRKDLQIKIENSDAELTIEELPCVEGDASQLRQVFQNLLKNAIAYSGDKPPKIHVAAERNDAEWVLSVRDEGIGVDPDQTDRIFQVFERLHTHDEHSGTGIGLALCERIVERHSGTVWVESEPGEGSTFSLTLPATDK